MSNVVWENKGGTNVPTLTCFSALTVARQLGASYVEQGIIHLIY